MKKMKILLLMLVFCLIFAVSYAGNRQVSEQGNAGTVSAGAGKKSGEKAGVSEKKQNAVNKKTQQQLETRTEKNACYVTANGETHEWQNRYNRKLQKYETTGDDNSMKKYLKRIAHRYRLENEEADNFVSWALQNRPWADD